MPGNAPGTVTAALLEDLLAVSLLGAEGVVSLRDAPRDGDALTVLDHLVLDLGTDLDGPALLDLGLGDLAGDVEHLVGATDELDVSGGSCSVAELDHESAVRDLVGVDVGLGGAGRHREGRETHDNTDQNEHELLDVVHDVLLWGLSMATCHEVRSGSHFRAS